MEVRGAAGLTGDKVSFSPGTGGTLNVGIGTNNPQSTLHVMGQVRTEHNDPQWIIREADAGLDFKQWKFYASGGQLYSNVTNDADTIGVNWLKITRDPGANPAGVGVQSIAFPAGTVAVGTSVPDLNYALHVSSGQFGLINAFPRLVFRETDAGADLKQWKIYADSGQFWASATNDADTAATNWLKITRSAGSGIQSVAFPAGTTAVGTSIPNLNYALHVEGNGQLGIQHNDPRLVFRESDAGGDYKQWKLFAAGGQFYGITTNDADTASAQWLKVTRNPASPGAGVPQSVALNAGTISLGDLAVPDVSIRLYTAGSARITGNLTVNGNLRVDGTASKTGNLWNAPPSDARLKKNIEPMTGALERMLTLRGVTFEWKDPKKMGFQSGTHLGLVAQEVEKVFPDWVFKDDEGIRRLQIEGFEALTVEAVRELRQQNDHLRRQLQAQEKEIQSLKKQR